MSRRHAAGDQVMLADRRLTLHGPQWSCPLDCGDSECQEWVLVPTDQDGYLDHQHASDCELERTVDE